MSILLSENPAHIEQLCSRLKLGQSREKVTSLSGGFHHRVWRLNTENGSFVVKQLAPDTDLDNKDQIKHYNVTEAIATRFAECGIAAVSARRCGEEFLHVIDSEAYLVYNWFDAVALKDGEVSPRHALKVAELLARMHKADIQVPGVESKLGEASAQEDVEEMVYAASESKLKSEAALREQLPLLLRVAQQYQVALPLLDVRQIISHGDFDQKNVLWDSEDNPVIIDWEGAHKINPTHEVVTVALEWSGITGDFDRALYSQFIFAYVGAGGVIREELLAPALHCVLGKWLDWLMYNVGRSVNLDSPKLRALGEEQIEFTLPVIIHLVELVPALLDDFSQHDTLDSQTGDLC